jgi:hypothetical protein
LGMFIIGIIGTCPHKLSSSLCIFFAFSFMHTQVYFKNSRYKLCHFSCCTCCAFSGLCKLLSNSFPTHPPISVCGLCQAKYVSAFAFTQTLYQFIFKTAPVHM